MTMMRPTRIVPRVRLNNVTPFTYRDGYTFLELVEELREWATNVFPKEIEGIIDVLVEELDKANEQYEAGVDEFQRIHDAFMADVNAALMALNDSAISDLLNDPESLTRIQLDSVAENVAENVVGPIRPENGQRAVGKGELTHNVLDYGAVGDGETDDTDAFQSAIDESLATGAPVYVPRGTYFIDGSVDISGATIYGDAGGYHGDQGTIIVGNGTNVAFNQARHETPFITMHISNFRFENVATAIRLTYTVYSTVSDVFVISPSNVGIILGDEGNYLIGPIWNTLTNVHVSAGTVNPALLLGGNDWNNNNVFNMCDFRAGDGGVAVRITTTGGYGAINNVFNATEFRGPGRGLVLDGWNRSTTMNECYFECQAPSIWIAAQTHGMVVSGGVWGTLRNDNHTLKPNFIHHNSGPASLFIDSGWVTVEAGSNRNNLRLVGSDAPTFLTFSYGNPVHTSIAASGFSLHDSDVLTERVFKRRGNAEFGGRAQPGISIEYPDGSHRFDIRRNGVMGVADEGVQFRNGDSTAMTIDNSNRVRFANTPWFASIESAVDAVPGRVLGKLEVRDAQGRPRWIPLYEDVV